MKKLILVASIVIVFINGAFAQNIFQVNGNVGIGTINPSYKLEVTSSNFVISKFRREASGGGAAIQIDNASGSGSWRMGVGSNNHFGIYKSSESNFGKQFIVLGNGNIGIGTTNPLSKLNINGGTGSLSTGLTFGDGNTGFYESADNTLITTIGGVNTFYWTGNLFRGTTTSSPALMHEVASSTNPTLVPSNNNQNTGIGWAGANELSLITGGTEALRINSSGNIGIGTSSPKNQLHVFKRSLANGQVHDILRIQANTDDQRQTGFGARINFSLNKYGNVADGTSSTLGAISVYDANNESSYGTMAFATKERYDKNLENKMWLDRFGNLGIGTSETFGYKLAVNGNIGAKEIKVENTSTWPDYVFENDYNLKPLDEVESFISENKHLPEVPSEAEVSESGINLGEMDAKLLQKIEELTLYMIDLNKQVKSQNQRIESLESENKELKKQIKN
ncbi:MAG: hypothetical protein JXR03_10820 [Cyclobacteriaceae bacterium]